MTDKFFQKQLEAFGIEQTRVSETDLKKRITEESRAASAATVAVIMSTMEGRRWMHEKLDLARVFTAPFAPGQPDVSAFLAGIQAYGQVLLAEVMSAAPNEFYAMNQEAVARHTALTKSDKD